MVSLARASSTKQDDGELASQRPQEVKAVGVRQMLGKDLNLSLRFVDQDGKERALHEFFRDGKTVLFTLNYYQCPQLCTYQLNGLVKGLKQLPPSFLKQSRMVTLSINPKETPKLATEKRAAYRKLLARDEMDWTFLVGRERDIQSLAKSLGFGYTYIPRNGQYAHPAVVFVLTSGGKISKYLEGLVYPPSDLKFAMMDASQGKIGSYLDKIFMSCFIFDDSSGKYTPFAFGLVRLGGVATLFFLSLFLLVMWLRERQRKELENAT
jgi:protein SCO1/2